MNEINKIWEIHLNSSFPKELYGCDIDGFDLVLLCADTSGCISTFLSKNGNLDLWRVIILGQCYRNLSLFNRMNESKSNDYYKRLEHLADLTLQYLEKKNNPDI